MSDAVREFVANAHGDLDAVRATLAEDSTYANAAWDWGGGTDALGPHGIPLRAHAEAGGELAAAVLAYLDA